jgi:hypothetical protein
MRWKYEVRCAYVVDDLRKHSTVIQRKHPTAKVRNPQCKRDRDGNEDVSYNYSGRRALAGMYLQWLRKFLQDLGCTTLTQIQFRRSCEGCVCVL